MIGRCPKCNSKDIGVIKIERSFYRIFTWTKISDNDATYEDIELEETNNLGLGLPPYYCRNFECAANFFDPIFEEGEN